MRQADARETRALISTSRHRVAATTAARKFVNDNEIENLRPADSFGTALAQWDDNASR